MRYLSYAQPERSTYPVVLLVPQIRKDDIRKTYFEPHNIIPDEVLVVEIHQAQGKKKTPAGEIREWLNEELFPVLDDVQAQYILVADADYFKVLTKSAKVEPYLGYVLDMGKHKVVYVPNYRAVFYDPEKVTAKIDIALKAFQAHRSNAYAEPGKDIIHQAEYPRSYEEIKDWLETILQQDVPVTVDIETFSLKHPTAGIGTITICWNQHEGIAFPVDYEEIPGATEAPYGRQIRNEPVRRLLKNFFQRLTSKAIYHNISFDAYILIYQLFMEDILDTKGLLEGLDVMLRNWDCTKLITYLATNSCAGNDLSLKTQAQEFAGNYAQENITDITKIPLNQLLEYNLVDGLATWFTYHKHYQTMVDDQQLDVYETLFKPATVDIIQMQLTGLPLNMQRVLEVETILQAIEDQAVSTMQNSTIIKGFLYHLNQAWVIKRNSELKVKRVTLADANETFNPNSNPQLQELLYEILELPVIALTDSKLPATDGDTLKALVNHTKNQEIKEFLGALIDYKAVNKLITSFIPAFKNATQGPDGWHYLFGNFNLGGTVSGRLSSSDPNLQNLPANVLMVLSELLIQRFGTMLEGYISKGKLILGKLIKSCFEAPPGWIFAGLDFDSLEDRISALTTKDPNKLKVYTDGYDGHCLRAHAYFGERMPDIDPTSVVSINSIAKKYPIERGDSKAPTFALTYQGTWSTLVKNCGFPEDQAKQIEVRFKELYKVSIDWVADKLDQACRDGYVTAAFGLRVRTPLLSQVIRGNSKTPREAEAEGRTAGNALGQSWCLLNTRGGSEFMGVVRKSEYRLFIRPCAQIHDAGYFLIRDDIGAIQFTNKHLVKAVQWQAHPEIAHPEVKLGGRLSLFYPTWASEIEIPNDATEEEIFNVVAQHLDQKKAA